VVGCPAETTEAFCDGHVRAFSFFGGVPQSILYDNTKIAVARILGDRKRQRARGFAELQSHYLFWDRFGRPGKGTDKGKVEGLVGLCATELPRSASRPRELRSVERLSCGMLPSPDRGPLARP
jgi:transposase